ncbi:MAG: tetratricopeptide repeat protein, partial [Candidatus Sericytochromatia bacterium]
MKPALSLLLGLTWALGPVGQASGAPRTPVSEAQAEAAGGHWREAANRYERAAEGPPSPEGLKALIGAVDACGRLGAFARAEGLATRAIAAAETLRDDRSRAAALTARARLRYRQQRFQEAETLARRGLAAAEKAGDAPEVGLAALSLGEALLEIDRAPEAAKVLERAVGVARQIDPTSLGERLQALALAHYYMGDPARALALCEEAVKLDREASRSAALVERLSGLAVFHVIRGQRFDDARALLDEALALARRLGRRDLEAPVLQRVATLEAFSGRQEAALRHQQAAFAIYRSLGMDTGAAQALADIGDLYKAWDRPVEARRALTDALAAETRLGRRFNQAMALRRLAELDSRAGEHDQALARYEAALAIHQALGRTLWQALTHLAIGGARAAKHDHPGALAAYDKALALARQLGNHGLMASCHEGAASVHSNRGRYDRAVALAERALAIHRRLGQDK